MLEKKSVCKREEKSKKMRKRKESKRVSPIKSVTKLISKCA